VTDYRLLLAARVLRGFGFGFSAVLLGLDLEAHGFSSSAIGIVLAIGVLAGSLYGFPMAALAARVGRRKVLIAIGGLMALTGLDLSLANQPWLLLLAGATGMLGASSVDLGPFSALEQSMLAEAVSGGQRNMAFGRYSLSGGLAAAAGGLAATLASGAALSAFFGLYALLGVGTAVLAALLSPGVESRQPGPVLSRVSRKPLAQLSALFALDSLGGGLVIQSVIAYWLHVRFGAGVTILGPALAAMALVQAGSYEVAARLANRIGLIRTMVFTHLPSSLLLMLVPLAPTLWLAIAILVLRFAISQMDVPARQAYVASIVPPSERAGALALTGTVRVGQSIGPALAGMAIQAAAYGVPFFLAGALKIAYDIGLYFGFRERPAEHEIV
jgi:MFS family permease